jgi:hypothetical protein
VLLSDTVHTDNLFNLKEAAEKKAVIGSVGSLFEGSIQKFAS